MFKKETINGSLKQLVHIYIYSIVINISHVISSTFTTCMDRTVQRVVYSSVTYTYSIVKRMNKDAKRGVRGCESDRRTHKRFQNHFLQLHNIDTQYSITNITKHTLYTCICHIIYIMLNSISRGYWTTAYFIQSLYRCIDITHVYNSMTRGQRIACNQVIASVSGQSYSTDLKSKRGGERDLSLRQNFFPKNLFWGSFSIPIYTHRYFSFITYAHKYFSIRTYIRMFISSIYTIRTIFYSLPNSIFHFLYLTLLLFLYTYIHIGPKKFYKKLFEKTNFIDDLIKTLGSFIFQLREDIKIYYSQPYFMKRKIGEYGYC
jgi:hypothetical protein